MSKVNELIKRFENGGEFPTAEEYKATMEADKRTPTVRRYEWNNRAEELRGNVLMG